MVAPNTTGGYNAGYIAPKKKKTLNPTIGGGYQAGYIAPTQTAQKTAQPQNKQFDLDEFFKATDRGFEGYGEFAQNNDMVMDSFFKASDVGNQQDMENFAKGAGIELKQTSPAPPGTPPPPPPGGDGFQFRADRSGGNTQSVQLPDGSSVSMSLNEWDTGGWRQFSHLTGEQRAEIRRRLAAQQTPGVTAPSIVGAEGAVGKPTAASEAVDGLGNQIKQASQGAAMFGFDDPNVRRSQENLVRQILGESEDLGRQAVENLAMPEFERSPLEGTLESFLMGQLNNGFTGDDQITQSNLADFDASAQKARAQQIEDLQRFGVLGDGVSSGSVADILGEFDSGIERGRGSLRAEGQRNLLNSILPNAQSLAQFQGNNASRNREFEANYNLARLGAQQDVADRSQARRMALTDPTGLQVFQEGVRQSNLANQRADRGLDQQLAALLGVTEDGRQTLGAQQLGQQDRQFLASLGLDRDRLNQQDRQFDRSADLQEGQLLGRFNGQDTLARDQVDLQNTQFLQDLGLRNRSLNIQDENADRDRNQRGSQFQQSLGLDRDRLSQQDRQFLSSLGLDERRLDQQDSQFDRSFGLDERRLDVTEDQIARENELDRIAQIIAAAEADIAGFQGIDVARLLDTILNAGVGLPTSPGEDEEVVVTLPDGTRQRVTRQRIRR